jgi:hypothetical protein
MSVAGYDLRYRGVEESRGANAQEIRAVVDVSREGEQLGTLRPGKNRYFAEQQVSNEAAIRSDPLNGEDLSSLRIEIDGETVFLRVLVKPLVNLLWIAGFVFLASAAIALWPDAERAAPAGGSVRPQRGTRPRVSPELLLGALLAAGAVVFVAVVPAGEGASGAAGAGRRTRARKGGGAGSRPRGAEGARVRPPHREDHGRGLPETGLSASAAGSGTVATRDSERRFRAALFDAKAPI